MDIVKRLRKWMFEENTYELLSEAADEIERLREVIENMTNLSNNLWHIGFTALNGDK